jgi:hypothetical protein
MADSWYQSGPGNYTSTANWAGGPGGFSGGMNVAGLGFNDIMNIAIANAQQRQGREQQMFDIKTREELAKKKWIEDQRNAEPTRLTPNQQDENARLRAAQLAQADAISRPAPMRQVEGAGIVPGLTMDPNSMTGAQRRVFLPEGSHAYPSGEPGGGFGKDLASPLDMQTRGYGNDAGSGEGAIVTAMKRRLAQEEERPLGGDGQGSYGRPTGGSYG